MLYVLLCVCVCVTNYCLTFPILAGAFVLLLLFYYMDGWNTRAVTRDDDDDGADLQVPQDRSYRASLIISTCESKLMQSTY